MSFELRQSWDRAWKDVGASGTGESVHAALVARYSEPHRHYHTMQHLEECLRAFDAVRELPQHPAEVEVALWFHDAIYDVKRSDNEEKSADWARSELTSTGASADAAGRVHALVMATKHSVLPATQDEKVLIDIDLSILGALEPRFAEYERQIREEYSFVPGFIFKSKRKAILKSFLDRPAIYSTEYFHHQLEKRARENLVRAIAG